MHIAGPDRLAQRFLALAGIAVLAAMLGACASSTSTDVLDTARMPAGPTPPITLAPIIGAPPDVSKTLSVKLAAAAADRKVPVVGAGDKTAEYTLRGYIATSPEAAQHKLSYIWDVTDKSGKRVHRITGEEVVAAKPGGNPWSSIDDQTIQKIAVTTVGNLATWLPTQTAAAPPTAKVGADKPAARKAPDAAPREFAALVPAVKGAPGDGKNSLARALQGQLRKNGIKLARNSQGNVYTVLGSVKLGTPAGGQQSISIDWSVTDPKGRKLGTVSQKNQIPKGSLDGPWGDIADAAAAAAAEKIIKLLPKKRN